MTTGGSGAIVTNDIALAKRAKHLTTTAKSPYKAFLHDEVGYNYQMPNLNAALVAARLVQLAMRLAQKPSLFEAYADPFRGWNGATLFTVPKESVSNNWLVTSVPDSGHATDRDYLWEVLYFACSTTRPIWTLSHCLPRCTQNARADSSQAEDLEARVFNIPSSAYRGARRGAAT